MKRPKRKEKRSVRRSRISLYEDRIDSQVDYSNMYAFRNSLRKASDSNVAERLSSPRIFLKIAETRWNVSAVTFINMSAKVRPVV